ncbi:MAG: O-antigen ligase family protein [Verrucomicrobia bacterium]|nr:O-antigen ligase family protein [Verrucomicrobiota bacterium]
MNSTKTFPGEWARQSHTWADYVTGCFICGMVVFSPWAFGTTQMWAMWVMNVCGYMLGALLLFKWLIRSAFGYCPERWGENLDGQMSASGILLTRALRGTTLAILAYCLVSALNARARFIPEVLQFEYRDNITWLPHSYDSTASWRTFWNYLALAVDFWAVRDWLLTKSPQELGKEFASRDAAVIPRRLETLLWVLAINGALLALEGLLQRAMDSSKLLWIIEPRINKSPEAQFGPYAYRSNAAQYMLMLWPLTLAFWWMLRRAPKGRRAGFRNYLLPCVLVMAMVPLASLSRAAAVIGLASIVAAIIVVLRFGERKRGALAWGISALLAVGLLVGTFVEWKQLGLRFDEASLDSQRHLSWQNTWKIVKDFPLYGAGPGTFDSVYFLYRPALQDGWVAQAHNDWLEFLVTFGIVGCVFLLSGLGLVLVSPLVENRFAVPRVFFWLVWLGLVSCLVFAAVDFPFQIYSLEFLFLLLCSVLTCVSSKQR